METNDRSGRVAPRLRRVVLTVAVVLALAGLGGIGRTIARAQADPSSGATGQPPLGSSVPITGTEGTEVAKFTVTKIEDPYETYDQNAPPERSTHFVVITLVIENSGPRPYSFNPAGVTLEDSEGFLFSQTYVYPGDGSPAIGSTFTGEDIAAGDTVSGTLGFQVLNSTKLVRIVFQPETDRLLFLADLTVPAVTPSVTVASPVATAADAASITADAAGAEPTAAAVTADTATPTGAATGDPTDAATSDTTDTTTDAGSATVEVSEADCSDIDAWYTAVSNDLDQLSTSLDAVFGAGDTVDAATLEQASSDLADAAETVRNSNPPALITDQANTVADGLESISNDLADLAEGGAEVKVSDVNSLLLSGDGAEKLSALDPYLESCDIAA